MGTGGRTVYLEQAFSTEGVNGDTSGNAGPMTELCQLLCKCRRALHLIQWTTGLTASEDGHIQHLVLVMEDDMRMAVWSGDPDDLVPCLVLLEGPIGQCECQEKGCSIKEQLVVR